MGDPQQNPQNISIFDVPKILHPKSDDPYISMSQTNDMSTSQQQSRKKQSVEVVSNLAQPR